MPRPRNLTPTYSRHKQSGRGRLTWTDIAGVRHEKLLPGQHGSTESLAAKARLELEIATSPTHSSVTPTDITLAEVLAAYLTHATRYYVDAAGKPTKELDNMKSAIKPARELYAATPAAQFGPKALAAVRQHMVGLGWCRSLVNRQVDRIRRVLRWAASEELIPGSTYEALRTLAGLRRGRTEARESEPVRPVADEVVAATLPYLPHHVRVIVELMMHTGMRPSEACRLTLDRLDRGSEVWVYRPEKHKTAHHGKPRVIPFGPKARAVLSAFLAGQEPSATEPVFSPRRAGEERHARLRAARKSKVQPSQVSRKKARPKRQPAVLYTARALAHAVLVAAEKAGVPHWHPYQLRHSYATKVRRHHGLEAAGAALGHTRMSATEVYAERDEQLAVNVAAKIG
ncbi:tyrosine-type recombinase/integrase [Urbifossiella limnaea]|uniref:Site-specific tyrosine recombinase XerC n=1 Tax=Urbifossiella limnaea TaxID=2528023 RepID=A0A517Y2A1_9BACT|nr:tyrosine-type recombinase/integrase [Urbifossiella limnaea]QDU23916.1 site-specific tyrosine recombinase XerC [Urbifossiella limnaea]